MAKMCATVLKHVARCMPKSKIIVQNTFRDNFLLFYFRCLSYDTATNRAHYITSESPPLSFSADSKGEHNKMFLLICCYKVTHNTNTT